MPPVAPAKEPRVKSPQGSQAKREEPCLIYELSRQEKSQWIPKKKGRAKDIKTAKFLDFDTRSRWNSGEEHGVQEIQYVPGAPTIFVNDYVDAATGEVKKGLLSLYGKDALEGKLLRRAVEENVKFVDGLLFLEHWGGKGNKTLIDFIEHHEFNEGSENYKRSPKMNPIFMFRPLVKEKKAAASIDNIDIEFEALSLLKSLSTVDGKGQREYDIPKINAILGALQEGLNIADNASGEKVLLIRSFIQRNAAAFVNIYKETMEEYSKTIKIADSLKVISFEPGVAKIKITTLEPVSFELKKDKREENVEDLIFHFLGTEEGRRLYMQVTTEVESKKIEALSK